MKFKLTWHEARHCWKKYADGKTYYLAKGKCKTKYDSEGYKAAMDEWQKIHVDLRAAAKATELFESDPEVAEKIALAYQNKLHWEKQYPNKTYEEAKTIEAALETHRRVNVELPKEKTVESHIDSFVKLKTAQVAADQKSAGRLRNIRTYVNRFGEFVGKQNAIETITAVTLSDFHARLLGEVARGGMSASSARDAMQVARQFIKWLWGLSVIELPNNIDSKDLEINVPSQAIEVWDFDILKGVLKAAPEPLRLYLLLMANCGMTQKDVSDLLPAQVNWKDGIITRKRSKTKKWENVPTVAYRLWGATFELLKKHGKKQGIRVLSAPDGSALVYDALSAGGKGSKNDKINSIWTEWVNSSKLKHAKGLAAIRKTSATALR
ncbi:MAG: hypothetical protein K8R92_12490 [Planctomycetes bacterium]|nr:hypothetical protein [Planctomycetota bacterium]